MVRGLNTEKMHRDNTLASATPCTDGRLVYVAFVVQGQLWVAAYDFDGKQAWERTLGGFESAHGFSTSLILDDTRLIVSGLQDGPDAFVAALEKSTGDTLWRLPRPRKIRSFSSTYPVPHRRSTISTASSISCGMGAWINSTGVQ